MPTPEQSGRRLDCGHCAAGERAGRAPQDSSFDYLPSLTKNKNDGLQNSSEWRFSLGAIEKLATAK